MGRPTPMHLSEEERDHVQRCVRRGKAMQAGRMPTSPRQTLDISEQTIRTLRQRFRAGGVAAVRTDTPPISGARFLMDRTIERCTC